MCHNQGFWQLSFHGVHFSNDSQNRFSVYHDSRTLKMVDHGVTKVMLSPSKIDASGYNEEVSHL